MSTFINDFNIFFNSIFTCIQKLWTWLFSNTLGEIILFTITISVFISIVYLLVDLKN